MATAKKSMSFTLHTSALWEIKTLAELSYIFAEDECLESEPHLFFIIACYLDAEFEKEASLDSLALGRRTAQRLLDSINSEIERKKSMG